MALLGGKGAADGKFVLHSGALRTRLAAIPTRLIAGSLSRGDSSILMQARGGLRATETGMVQ